MYMDARMNRPGATHLIDRYIHVPTNTNSNTQQVAGQRHGRPVDLWSAGCLLYSLLTGRAPFPRAGHGNHSGASNNSGPSHGSGFSTTTTPPPTVVYEEPAGLCAAGRDFLRRLLEPDPLKRPTAWAMLAHPFLTGEAQHGAAWGYGGGGVEEEEGEHMQHDRTHSYSQSHSQLLNDSSMLTVVPGTSAAGRGPHHGHYPQHWSSGTSVATVAPSLAAPPPPVPARRRSKQQQPPLKHPAPQPQKLQQKQQQPTVGATAAVTPVDDPPLALSLEIPAPMETATTPPAPHHRLYPRRSRRARAKAAAELEAAQQRRAASAAAAVAAPFYALPFLLPLQALQLSSSASRPGKTTDASAAPLIPIDASRLRPGRFLLPHPSGQHEGLLRLKRDGAVSLKMRATAPTATNDSNAAWRWSLSVRPGGLRVRVLVALAPGPMAGAGGFRNEAEYTLGELPVAYHAAYRYCWRLVQGVRAMTPKVSG